MSKTILIVEDDARVADIVNRYLRKESFTLMNAQDGEGALELFAERQPNMVILDLVLPKMDGNTVCEKIRETSDVPIIMLTALNEEVDLLTGFGKGADDYIAKPFNPRELVARVHALLRRTQSTRPDNNLNYGNISLSPEERRVTCNGATVKLTQMEFNILHLLIANPKKVFTRDELLSGSRSSFAESNDRSVDFHIKNLRRKISEAGGTKNIETIYGVGFKME